MHEDGIEAARGQQPLDGPVEGRRIEITEGGRPTRKSEEPEPRPRAESGQAADMELVAVAPELLTVGLLLCRPRQRGHGDLVTPREMANHVERTDLPSALGRIGHPVTEEENLHVWLNGAPRVP